MISDGKVTFNEVTRCLSSIAPGVPYNASVTGYNVVGYGKTITAYGYIQELGKAVLLCIVDPLFIHPFICPSLVSLLLHLLSLSLHLLSFYCSISCLFIAPSYVSLLLHFLSLYCSISCLFIAPFLVSLLLHLLPLYCSISCLFIAPFLVSLLLHLLSLYCSISCLFIAPFLLFLCSSFHPHFAYMYLHISIATFIRSLVPFTYSRLLCVMFCFNCHVLCLHTTAPSGLLSVKTTLINGSTIVVSWNPLSPVEARGFVRYYLVTWTPSSSKARGSPGSANLTANATMFLITGLDPMVSYTISVSAGTSAGVGAASNTSTMPVNPSKRWWWWCGLSE